ncbi:MAG: hypothetical protein M1829_004178 [Trizodia sp. TS-e1964]|nr:MAG: hypothetical protein M1829_004178 [Trizodia sp. TS-e1964]
MGFFSGRSGSYSTVSGHSSRRARPREGYIQRLLHKLRRLFRDLMYYARKHPMKVFMMVIMPLITGGALAGVLAKVGIRLPPGLFGGHRSGGSEYGAQMGGAGGIGSLIKVAQMLI